MIFIYQILYLATIVAFFYILIQFTNFKSISKVYTGWNIASEKLPFLKSTFGKVLALIVVIGFSKSIETKIKNEDTNNNTASVAQAPAQAPLPEPANPAAAWQKQFFSTVKEYAKRTNLIDNPELGKNRTRAEQEEYDNMVARGKATIAEATGKMLTDQKCWYLGRQNQADTELWCYDSKYSPEFLFKVKITENDAKMIGQLFKDDEFIFSGTIGEIELEPISYNGGNVRKDPPTIRITAQSIRPIK